MDAVWCILIGVQRQMLPLFSKARHFVILAQYWLVPRLGPSVISQSN